MQPSNLNLIQFQFKYNSKSILVFHGFYLNDPVRSLAPGLSNI